MKLVYWFIGLLGIVVGLRMAVLPVSAQDEVEASIVADREVLTVGDPVWVTVDVVHPVGYRLQLPALAWDDFEVLEIVEPEVTPSGTGWQFAVTLWRPGVYELPPLTLELMNADGGVVTAVTPPLQLTAQSVLTDDDLELRDIRPQASLPPQDMSWGWIWLVVVLGLGVVMAVWRWQWKPAVDSHVNVQAHPVRQRAISQMDQLASQNLPQQGQVGAFVTAVLHIIRQFLQDGYGLPADFQTSAEIETAVTDTILPDHEQENLAAILHQIDAIRFSPNGHGTKIGLQVVEPVRDFIKSAPLSED